MTLYGRILNYAASFSWGWRCGFGLSWRGPVEAFVWYRHLALKTSSFMLQMNWNFFPICAQVVWVWLEMAYCHVNTRFTHSICSHFVNETPTGVMECGFCHQILDAEVVRSFDLKITLADEGGKVFAWSTGKTATELLQISPDEFHELPEVMFELKTQSDRLFFCSHFLCTI